MSVTITRQPIDFNGYPGIKTGVSVSATGSGYLDFLSFYPWTRDLGTGVITYGSNYLGIFPDIELKETSATLNLGNGPSSLSLKMSFGGNPQAGEYFWFDYSNGTEKLMYIDANVYLGAWGLSIYGTNTNFIDYDNFESIDLEVTAEYDGSKITISATDGITPKQVIGAGFTPAGSFPGDFKISFYTNVDVTINSAKFTAPVMPKTAISYEWYRNGSFVSNDVEYKFTPTITDDGDQFYCIVSDVDGDLQSNTVTMSVSGDYQVFSENTPIGNTTDIYAGYASSPIPIGSLPDTYAYKTAYLPVAAEDDELYYFTDAEMIARDYTLGIAATQRYGPSYMRTQLSPTFTPVWP